jgi:hypothetical protein
MMTALPPLDHVVTLSDDVGIVQHAVESVPNRSSGYCTDDVARAFIVALARLRFVPGDADARRLASTYLAFLHDAQTDDGRFHNFMSYDRRWLDDVGTHDSYGRAMWALGYGVRFAPSAPWQRICRRLLERALPSIDALEYARAQAYAILGLAHARRASAPPPCEGALRTLARRLVSRYTATHEPQWDWFETEMTYDNARLPEALLRAGAALEEPEFGAIGAATLAFLERVVFERGVFVPIGNEGWYRRGGARARFAQQPLEAAAMVDAELAAFEISTREECLTAARAALAWFYGSNSVGVMMAQGGGCYDGLHGEGPNRNMGAESTLAHLQAAYAMAAHRGSAVRVAR